MTNAGDALTATSDDAVLATQVSKKLAELEAATLRILALAAGTVFGIRIIASLIVFPVNQVATIVGPLSISVAVSASILIALWRGKLPDAWIRPFTTLLSTLITCNVFYILHATGNLNQFFFASLVMVAFGLGAATLSMWLMLAIPFVIIFVASLFILGIENMAPYIAVLVGGCAISAVAFYVRVPAIRKLVELEVIQSINAEKLAQSNKAKDQFLANMTHELRTPLTGVMGMIDLMADTKLSVEQEHYLDTARKSAHYLLMVINDILDVAKLEAGKLVLNAEAVDAVLVTKDIASIFDHRVRQKGLTLRLDLPDQEKFPVRGDNIRISQILLNLLENALKFTQDGHIHITLEADEVNGGETVLKWTVRDTGVGIAEDRLPKLFDRFEQVDSSSTRTTGGTGLGLAIIRDLVHLMQGKVGATSVVGEGSSFWFQLKLPTLAVEDLPARSQSQFDRKFVSENSRSAAAEAFGELRTPEQDSGRGSVHILFAEDNPVNRELIGRFIKREGWTGTAVTNGQEAVEAMRANGTDYDLILMDIQMPVMDGLTAYKAIRDEIGSSPPIVALTANTLPEDMRHYAQAGFDAIVGKPINMAELREVVEKLKVPTPEN